MLYLWLATIFGYTSPDLALSGVTLSNNFFKIGGFGNSFANFNRSMFGYVSYIYLPLLLLPIYRLHDDTSYSFRKIQFTFAYLLLFVGVLMLQSLIFNNGQFGNYLQSLLVPYIGSFGFAILTFIVISISLLLIAERTAAFILHYLSVSYQMAWSSINILAKNIFYRLKSIYYNLKLDRIQIENKKMVNEELSEKITTTKSKYIDNEPLLEKALDEYLRISDSNFKTDMEVKNLTKEQNISHNERNQSSNTQTTKEMNITKDSEYNFNIKIKSNDIGIFEPLTYQQYDDNNALSITHTPRTQVRNNDEELLRRFQKSNVHPKQNQQQIFHADEPMTFRIKQNIDKVDSIDNSAMIQQSKIPSQHTWDDWKNTNMPLREVKTTSLKPKTQDSMQIYAKSTESFNLKEENLIQDNNTHIKSKDLESFIQNDIAMQQKAITQDSPNIRIKKSQMHYNDNTENTPQQEINQNNKHTEQKKTIKIATNDTTKLEQVPTQSNYKTLDMSFTQEKYSATPKNNINNSLINEDIIINEPGQINLTDIPINPVSTKENSLNETFSYVNVQEESKLDLMQTKMLHPQLDTNYLQDAPITPLESMLNNDYLETTTIIIPPLNNESNTQTTSRDEIQDYKETFIMDSNTQSYNSQDSTEYIQLENMDNNAIQEDIKEIFIEPISQPFLESSQAESNINNSDEVGINTLGNNQESIQVDNILQNTHINESNKSIFNTIENNTNKQNFDIKEITEDINVESMLNQDYTDYIKESSNDNSLENEDLQTIIKDSDFTKEKDIINKDSTQNIQQDYQNIQNIMDDTYIKENLQQNQIQNIKKDILQDIHTMLPEQNITINTHNKAPQHTIHTITQTHFPHPINENIHFMDMPTQHINQEQPISYIFDSTVYTKEIATKYMESNTTQPTTTIKLHNDKQANHTILNKEINTQSKDYSCIESKIAQNEEMQTQYQESISNQDREDMIIRQIAQKKEDSKQESNIIIANLDTNTISQAQNENIPPFILPPLKLLQKPVEQNIIQDFELDSKIEKMLQIFNAHKICGDIIGTLTGPVVTTFEFRPETHVKVSKILSHKNDLARILKAKSIRIQAPIPGKDVIGIQIPNSKVETIYLREILNSQAFLDSRDELTIALGKDISGIPIVANLAKLPHLLVAGTTGSGKSVGVNAIILSLLYRNDPDNLKLMMIDPKQVEFAPYEDLPHLITPIINAPNKAIKALQAATIEMDKRYELFSQIKVKNIHSYNEKVGIKMPNFVIIIDELADLMITGGKEAEAFIARIAQMGRAAGIHLIIATQRSSVNVITGHIKANLPSRISYRVGSRIDSKVILDEMGAEDLLGNGDGLFTTTSGLMRIHAPWVSEQEVEHIVDFIKAQREPQYDESFLSETKTNIGSSDKFSGDGSLIDKAKEIILQDNRTSISYLQRKLGIGYNKSASIVEALEQEGFLSAPNSKGERNILT